MPLIPFLRKRSCLVFATATLMVTGCASDSLEVWRQIPVQMARISQTESYKQIFLISTPNIEDKQNTDRDKALDERMDNIFNKMVGDKNWQHLKNLYGISSVRDELMTGQIHLDGLIKEHSKSS